MSSLSFVCDQSSLGPVVFRERLRGPAQSVYLSYIVFRQGRPSSVRAEKINFREPAKISQATFYALFHSVCSTCHSTHFSDQKGVEMVKESLELLSLPGRGRTEVIRLMLTFCQKPFTDTRLTIAQWKIKRKQGRPQLDS